MAFQFALQAIKVDPVYPRVGPCTGVELVNGLSRMKDWCMTVESALCWIQKIMLSIIESSVLPHRLPGGVWTAFQA